MVLRQLIPGALCAALCAGGTAAADPLYATVTATYDTTFGSTSITIDNPSAVTETGITLWTNAAGTPSTELLADLAPGQSETYTFAENQGGFISDPAAALLVDTTAYSVSFVYNGAAVTSLLFSPGSNFSGSYVDFLGNCYAGNVSCPGQSGNQIVESGLVAEIPEPASLALLGLGIPMLAAGGRRRAARS